jgi:hypothetical protein
MEFLTTLLQKLVETFSNLKSVLPSEFNFYIEKWDKIPDERKVDVALLSVNECIHRKAKIESFKTNLCMISFFSSPFLGLNSCRIIIK